LLTVLVVICRSTLTASIFAPGTGAPVASVTDPVMDARNSCGNAGTEKRAIAIQSERMENLSGLYTQKQSNHPAPYERRAMMTLMFKGVADARRYEGGIRALGLVEMQPTRPKLFSALSTDDTFAPHLVLHGAGRSCRLDQSRSSGTPVLRRIARNVTDRRVDHRVVFGFGYRTAPKLVAFLKKHRISNT
jgi:hypothetical protein